MSSFAVHRLSGIATPANAMYSASELEYQLKASGAKALITCVPLLETALKAARSAGIPDDRVFITEGAWEPKKVPFKTLDELIKEGRSLPELEPLDWVKGQGSRQVAYLCFSSGTSGLPVSRCFYRCALLTDRGAESSHDLAPECHRQHHANTMA